MIQAHEQARQCVDLTTQYYQMTHPVTLSSLNNLAIILKKNGEYLEAKQTMIAVFEGYCHMLGAQHKHTLIALQNLADIYRLNNEGDTSAKLLEELVELKENMDDKNAVDIIHAKNKLASAYREIGQYEKSEYLLNK